MVRATSAPAAAGTRGERVHAHRARHRPGHVPHHRDVPLVRAHLGSPCGSGPESALRLTDQRAHRARPASARDPLRLVGHADGRVGDHHDHARDALPDGRRRDDGELVHLRRGNAVGALPSGRDDVHDGRKEDGRLPDERNSLLLRRAVHEQPGDPLGHAARRHEPPGRSANVQPHGRHRPAQLNPNVTLVTRKGHAGRMGCPFTPAGPPIKELRCHTRS